MEVSTFIVERRREMARKKKKTSCKEKKPSGLNPLVYEVIGLAMMGLAVIIIFEFGIVGRGLSSVSRFILGNWHSAIPLLLIVQALMFMIKRKAGGWKNRIVGGSLFILASLVLFSHVYLFKELHASRLLLTDSALKETWKVLITNGGYHIQKWRTRWRNGGRYLVCAVSFSF